MCPDSPPTRPKTLEDRRLRASGLLFRVVVLLFSGPLVAGLLLQGAAPPNAYAAEDESAPALTALEAGPVRRADLIVVGRIAHLQEVRSPGGGRGRQLVRVQIVEVLLGEAPEAKLISVMVLGQRPTLNPDQPSVPYFKEPGRDLFVLFLGRRAGQFAFRLQTLFEGKGAIGREKIAVSKAIARLAVIQDPDEKAQRTFAALMAMTKGAGRWTKAFAAREMSYLAGVRPEVFDARSRARLQRIPSVTLTPDQSFWFKRLFKTLAKTDVPGMKRASPDPAEKDPWRATFRSAVDPDQRRSMLSGLLVGGRDGLERNAAWAWREMEPSLKIWFARAVSELGQGSPDPSSGPSLRLTEGRRLRRVYGGEEDPEVRAAIIRTVGLSGNEDDVAWLVQRSNNLRMRRPALLGLARIGTPKARSNLSQAQKAAEKGKETDLAKWIEHLLSPAFAESERKAGR